MYKGNDIYIYLNDSKASIENKILGKCQNFTTTCIHIRNTDDKDIDGAYLVHMIKEHPLGECIDFYPLLNSPMPVKIGASYKEIAAVIFETYCVQ